MKRVSLSLFFMALMYDSAIPASPEWYYGELKEAISTNSTELLYIILQTVRDQGGNLLRTTLALSDENGKTLLHKACLDEAVNSPKTETDRAAMSILLIRYGASLFAVDCDGRTPLGVAKGVFEMATTIEMCDNVRKFFEALYRVDTDIAIFYGREFGNTHYIPTLNEVAQVTKKLKEKLLGSPKVPRSKSMPNMKMINKAKGEGMQKSASAPTTSFSLFRKK